MPTITIRDQATTGGTTGELTIDILSEELTVRELIRARVYQEVQDFNRRQDEVVFKGLVQPTDAERVLNGNRTEYRLKTRREIDWKKQFEKATDAFERNGFFILIDDKQAESLDQEITIGHDTELAFVRLTQLVGG